MIQILIVVIAMALDGLPAGSSNPCMQNPKDGVYYLCAHASMGKCHHYTTTCEP